MNCKQSNSTNSNLSEAEDHNSSDNLKFKSKFPESKGLSNG